MSSNKESIIPDKSQSNTAFELFRRPDFLDPRDAPGHDQKQKKTAKEEEKHGLNVNPQKFLSSFENQKENLNQNKIESHTEWYPRNLCKETWFCNSADDFIGHNVVVPWMSHDGWTREHRPEDMLANCIYYSNMYQNSLMAARVSLSL